MYLSIMDISFLIDNILKCINMLTLRGSYCIQAYMYKYIMSLHLLYNELTRNPITIIE